MYLEKQPHNQNSSMGIAVMNGIKRGRGRPTKDPSIAKRNKIDAYATKRSLVIVAYRLHKAENIYVQWKNDLKAKFLI